MRGRDEGNSLDMRKARDSLELSVFSVKLGAEQATHAVLVWGTAVQAPRQASQSSVGSTATVDIFRYDRKLRAQD